MKPSLTWEQQVRLLASRGLEISDEQDCAAFLAANNYYRFSGYARYFQRDPKHGDDRLEEGTSFDAIRRLYEADEALREILTPALATDEVLLRTHTAHVIGQKFGTYGRHLAEDFTPTLATQSRLSKPAAVTFREARSVTSSSTEPPALPAD